VVADADGVAAVGVDCSPPAVRVLRDVLELVCAPWVLTPTAGTAVASLLGLVWLTVSVCFSAAPRRAVLVVEESLLAAPGSSTVLDLLCRDPAGEVATAGVADATWVIRCGPVVTPEFAAFGCSCGEFDEVAADTDPVGLESAGGVESGAAAAKPCPVATAAPRPAATAPVRNHRTERGVAPRR
jgi:hypothetical protein